MLRITIVGKVASITGQKGNVSRKIKNLRKNQELLEIKKM